MVFVHPVYSFSFSSSHICLLFVSYYYLQCSFEILTGNVSALKLEDTRRLADAEARDRASLVGKFRNLESDLV